MEPRQPIRAPSKLIVRSAVAGMIVAVVGLGALALWGAVVTESGAARVTQAGVQATGHLRAVQALSMIDAHTDSLEDEYDPQVRADLDEALDTLEHAVVRMRTGGLPETAALAVQADPAVRRLRPAIERFVAVSESGTDDGEKAEDAMEEEIHALDGFVHSVDADPSVVLTDELESVTDRLGRVRKTALGLVPIGLLFVALAAWLLRGYRRRSEAAMRHEIERSATEARTDQLTGLANRRGLLEDLEAAEVDGGPAVLMLADLNGFKQYNDTFGHPAGDALLQRLAKRLQTAFAGRGTAARLGGDEFCVLVRGDVREEDVQARARMALSEHGEGFNISASCGTVATPRDAVGMEAMLRLADARMYAAKRGSRPGVDAFVAGALLRMLDERHPGLGATGQDVADVAQAAAASLGLSQEDCQVVRRAAELHDIGNVAIPATILTKPGPLTEPEFDFVRRHPVIGERILLGTPSLEPVAAVVRSSHERWDGRGYPDRLAGEEIPLAARIVAVSSAFAAMTGARPYAESRSREDAVAELQACAGTQFDPAAVAAFTAALAARPVSLAA